MAHLAGFEIEHPLMNGAGVCKTVADVHEFARSCVSAIVVGSITEAERTGNPGENYWSIPMYSINSLGLPNPGLRYYEQRLAEMAHVAHDNKKLLIASVAGVSIEEYVKVAIGLASGGADMLELNLGCPNVWDDGTQKAIPCFDLQYMLRICDQVSAALRRDADTGPPVPFGIKISPFSDPHALERMAQVLTQRLNEWPHFRFVTATNTFPNAYARTDAGTSSIAMGLGGLGGPAMKPIALGHVKRLREMLPVEVDLIGVGGITNGRPRAGTSIGGIQMDSLVIRRPDDFHLHVRQGDMLKAVLPVSAQVFGRAIIMPNTDPPIETSDQLVLYRSEIVATNGLPFTPLMTIKITGRTTVAMIRSAAQAGAIAGRLYPFGVTTNSSDGVHDIREAYPAFAEMADVGMVLCIHCEQLGEFCLDREEKFLTTALESIVVDFPLLRVVVEHASTAAAVNWVRRQRDQHGRLNIAATITPHHLRLHGRSKIVCGRASLIIYGGVAWWGNARCVGG